MFDPEFATSSDMKTVEEIAKLAGKCLKMELDKRPEMLEVAERLRKIRKAPRQVQERLALFSWGRKSKLGSAQTTPLESSSSSENVRTVAPAETAPSQESNASTPKMGTAAPSKAVPSQESSSSTRNGGTFIITLTETGQLFELDDLLRASAEVLGKGTVASTYKVTLASGYELVVKRLKNVDMSKMEFEKHITLIGAVQSKHIAPLRWYYYSKDETLLVYNIFPMGSLAKGLHGDRVSGAAPLDWEQRLAISLGVARGVEAIHLAGRSSCHGNIKSSNILLTGTHDACVSENGLITRVMYSNASGYHAPEVTGNRRLTKEADVYSFGVLLIELLTGKDPLNSIVNDQGVDLPRWVRSVVREEWMAEVFDVELLRREQKDEQEEGMFRLLQLAMNCCSQDANLRPTISDVVQRIEEIR